MRCLAEELIGRSFCALIILTSLTQVSAAQARWHKFSAPDGDFTVEFPTPPQHSILPNDYEGSPVEVFFSEMTGKHSFNVGYHDAPRPADGTSRESLKALVEGCRLSTQETRHKLLRVRQLPGGVVECFSTGPSVVDLYPTDHRLERTFVRGRRYYAVSVISWTGKIDWAMAARFFSSFRLTPARGVATTGGGRVQSRLPPLMPQYAYDQFSGVTRVNLPLSPVEGATGASNIQFGSRYAYAKEWRSAGTMNEVMFLFGMTARGEVCPRRCQLTLTVDGERSSFEVEVQSKPAGNGVLSQTVSFWLKPQSFRRLAAARNVDVHVGSVTFRLTDRQMDGLRQMLPFLKERILP
jgi:hypothetical protein